LFPDELQDRLRYLKRVSEPSDQEHKDCHELNFHRAAFASRSAEQLNRLIALHLQLGVYMVYLTLLMVAARRDSPIRPDVHQEVAKQASIP
jgi:hypothetical protein